MAFGMQEASGDTVLSLAAASATANSGAIAAQGGAAYVLLMVQITAITGTSPTLVVKLQESSDNATWSDVVGATTASLTAVGSAVAFGAPAKGYVRAVATIGGTTPAVTATIAALAFPE
jgi:hypothetical protein